MFDLPKSTEIRKQVHKKLIYSKFATELSGDKKDRFDADISRIIITNEISEASVNIKATDKVSSMFVIQIELKTKNYNDRNIILVSKLFGQNLLLVLHYEDKYQLAIYETKLLKSDWKSEEEFSLKLNGLDLNVVWDNFVTQVSGINVDKIRIIAFTMILVFLKPVFLDQRCQYAKHSSKQGSKDNILRIAWTCLAAWHYGCRR